MPDHTPQNSSTNKLVFLIGFMGSGKTTLGRKLARKTGWEFIDLDERIVSKVGMPIPAYFAEFGEAAFRDLERLELKNLSTAGPAIISTGGGTPCFFDNMQWMNESGLTIYLNLPAKTIWDRLRKSNIASRPALKGLSGDDLLHHIQEKLAERQTFYTQASLIVDQLPINVVELARIILR